ncbi:MAG: acetyltransferase [Chloroflexi bacterium]|nr:acetyltransferase [Chloroflexota bacterium]
MPTKPKIAIVGASGHAKVVMDVIERQGRYTIAGLLDTYKPAGETCYGYRILGSEMDLPALAREHRFEGCFIAIGDNWTRHLVAGRIRDLMPGLPFISAVHPSAQVARGASLGAGTVLMAGAIVNSDSRVGEFCIINTGASLDHDNVMGDFSSLGPEAVTGGNVTIGRFGVVAMRATILHGLTVGEQAVVGAGALVLKDIPELCMAFGVPARVVRSRQVGEKYL